MLEVSYLPRSVIGAEVVHLERVTQIDEVATFLIHYIFREEAERVGDTGLMQRERSIVELTILVVTLVLLDLHRRVDT